MHPPTLPPPDAPPVRPRVIGTRSEPTAPLEPAPRRPDLDRWLWVVGAFVAAVALAAVLPRPFVWVLCAIPHEMGHATVACLLGRPAAPAISLAGHAWTGIADLVPLLPWLWSAAFGFAAWSLRSRHLPLALCVGAAVAVPALSFHGTSEVLISAAGHIGELLFAGYCYATIWSGGRTGSLQERLVGGALGAMIQSSNLKLCAGLMFDAAARDDYATSGSLGLKNDYLVLAEDLCDCRLQTIAALMLLLSLLPLPLGLWWGARRTVD